MRMLTIVLLVLGCAGGGSSTKHVEDPRCAYYEETTGQTASEEFAARQGRSEILGEELALLQKAGVPDDDPRSLPVAVSLGETLGRMYLMCLCEETLVSGTECTEFRAAMEQAFGW
jgi:hypothetical protein